ncbi:hypothetical protein RchiOBHm_Chr2g0116141 [Rosa chinensis]|uniref:Uncharacterized protein n=1 Tax=Rosa chinensis TaxID=74649 RepID=A0A2P6RR62_ROSCH|nr:hypothetical protein RchiOBHm_Chr2g0116141 [Rosa chinensis]
MVLRLFALLGFYLAVKLIVHGFGTVGLVGRLVHRHLSLASWVGFAFLLSIVFLSGQGAVVYGDRAGLDNDGGLVQTARSSGFSLSLESGWSDPFLIGRTSSDASCAAWVLGGTTIVFGGDGSEAGLDLLIMVLGLDGGCLGGASHGSGGGLQASFDDFAGCSEVGGGSSATTSGLHNGGSADFADVGNGAVDPSLGKGGGAAAALDLSNAGTGSGLDPFGGSGLRAIVFGVGF